MVDVTVRERRLDGELELVEYSFSSADEWKDFFRPAFQEVISIDGAIAR